MTRLQLDKLDIGILRLLQEDARLSFRSMAKKLGTTTPTVSARVKHLEELGILRGYSADVDAGVLGGTLHLLRISVPPRSIEKTARSLVKFPGVEELLVASDGRLHVRFLSQAGGARLADLHAAIGELEDVAGIDAVEVLGVKHRARVLGVREEIEILCHQCQGPIRGPPVQKTIDGRSHVFCCRVCMSEFTKRAEKVSAVGGKRRESDAS